VSGAAEMDSWLYGISICCPRVFFGWCGARRRDSHKLSMWLTGERSPKAVIPELLLLDPANSKTS